MTCRRSPASAGAGSGSPRSALLIAVLAAGGLIAAYLIHVGGSSDASSTTAHTTGPTTQPVGTSASTVAAPTLTPVKLVDATSYDPQGDGSESQYLAPDAIDGNPATAWRTETYKGQVNDLAGKQGVGLVLDAGRAVSARALRISTSAARLAGARVLDARGGDPERPHRLVRRVGVVRDDGRLAQGGPARALPRATSCSGSRS